MHLLRFDSLPAWISSVCALWRDRLRMNPALNICLPTGLTPAAVYAELARNVDRGDVSFTRASVFALDEFGGLPSDDPGLTRNTLRRQLVSLVDLPSERFHCFDPNGTSGGRNGVMPYFGASATIAARPLPPMSS